MGLSLSREHHAIFVVLCHSILLFDPRREHSSVSTAYFHRRRAQRRSRTVLLQLRRRFVLDGREHGGRLAGDRVVGRAMIRGEPAIGRDQSREPRLYSVEPVWGPVFVKEASRHFYRPLSFHSFVRPAPRAFFRPDRIFPPPSRAPAVKDGASSAPPKACP